MKDEFTGLIKASFMGTGNDINKNNIDELRRIASISDLISGFTGQGVATNFLGKNYPATIYNFERDLELDHKKMASN